MCEECPSSEQLTGFVASAIDEKSAERIAGHLTSCSDCEQAVVLLEKQRSDVWCQLKELDAASPFESEGAFHELMAAKSTLHGAAAENTVVVGDDDGAKSKLSEIPPEQLRDYRILEKIGEGGMGAVYKAEHSRLKKTVAVKILSAERFHDASAVSRFEREMEVVGKLDHPNIVRATDAGEEDGRHYLVMEYVDGDTLSDIIRRERPLPIAEACSLIGTAAEALGHTHELGLVHRDVKPSNMMVADRNTPKSGTLKLLDLGLALLRDSPDTKELTAHGQLMGTIDYMAPEQAGNTHTVDHRADIYSLGASLYKLLTGAAPFDRDDCTTPLQKLSALAVKEPEPIQSQRTDIPDGLAMVIHRMLEKEPGNRFESAEEVATALAPFSETLSGGAISEADSTTKPAPKTSLSNFGGRRIGVISVLIGVLGFLAYFSPTIIRFATNKGVVVIESDAKDIEVTVRDGSGVIRDTQTNRTIELTAGEYGLEVKMTDATGETRFVTREVTLSRGGEQVVRAFLEDAKPPRKSTERVAAGKADRAGLSGDAATSADHITAAPGDFTNESTWAPGTRSVDLKGLVPEPADLPGIPQWTIRTRRPVGGLFSPADITDNVDYSSTGNVLAWAASHHVHVVDADSRRTRFLGPASDRVCISPDGQHVALGQMSGTRWEIWTTAGRRVHTFGLLENNKEILPFTARWLPDGKQLAFWSRKRAELRSIDGTKQKTISFEGDARPRSYSHAEQSRIAATVDPSGTQIAFACQDSRLRVWNIETNELSDIGEPFASRFRFSPSWSPDGRTIAVSLDDGIQFIRPDGTRGPKAETESSGGLVAWSPDNRYIACGFTIVSPDGKVVRKLQHSESHVTRRSMWIPSWPKPDRIEFVGSSSPGADAGRVLAFHRDGRLLQNYSAPLPLHPSAAIWQEDTGEIQSVYHTGEVFQWKQDGSANLIYSDPRESQVSNETINPHSGRIDGIGQGYWHKKLQPTQQSTENVGQALGMLWSPDGRRLAVAHRSAKGDVEIQVRNQAESVAWAWKLPRGNGNTISFAWDAQSKKLAWSDAVDETQVFWIDLSVDGTDPKEFEDVPDHLLGLEWSPASRHLMGSGMKAFYVWDAETRTQHQLARSDTLPAAVWIDDDHFHYAGQIYRIDPQDGIQQVDSVRDDRLQSSQQRWALFPTGHLRNESHPFAEFLRFDGQPRKQRRLAGNLHHPSAIYQGNHRRSGKSVFRASLDGYRADCLALANLEAARFDWFGLAFSDGKSVTFRSDGGVIRGPEDIDRYLTWVVQSPGGREVAVSHSEFHRRIGLDPQSQAMNRMLDLGGSLMNAESGEGIERSNVDSTEDLPQADFVSIVDLSRQPLVHKADIELLSNFPSLNTLYLQNSGLSELPDLSPLKKLQVLDVSGTSISSIDGLHGITSLEHLNLSGTQMSTGFAGSLRSLSGLQNLVLSNVTIDDFVLLDLFEMTHLRHLTVSGLSDTDLAKLKNALPECEVTAE